MPIGFGKISANHKPFVTKSPEYFLGYIAARIASKRRLCNFVVSLFGVKHAKAIVMFCRKNDVFHPRIFGGCGPFFRRKLRRVERILEIFVGFFVFIPIVFVGPASLTPTFVFGTQAPAFYNSPLAVSTLVHQ